MATLEQDRAAMRKAGLTAIPLDRQQRPCPGPDEPTCIQALCVDCGSFSTAPSLATPMQPAARFVRGNGWECVEFHAATVADCGETRKPAFLGGDVLHSDHTTGVMQ
jgi:hypothetical protein